MLFIARNAARFALIRFTVPMLTAFVNGVGLVVILVAAVNSSVESVLELTLEPVIRPVGTMDEPPARESYALRLSSQI